MRSKSAVDGEEPQTLDLTLRKQHPIERIAGLGFWVDRGERVASVDRDDLNAQAIEKLR